MSRAGCSPCPGRVQELAHKCWEASSPLDPSLWPPYALPRCLPGGLAQGVLYTHFPLHCLSVISISPSTLTNKRPRASGRNPPPSGEPPDMPGTACAHLRDTYWLAQVSVGFRLHFPDVVAVWKKGHGKSVTWCLTERIPRKHTPRSRRTAWGQQPPSGGPTRPARPRAGCHRQEQSRVCATVDGRQAQRGDLGDSHPNSGTGNLVEPKDLALQGSAWWWGRGLPQKFPSAPCHPHISQGRVFTHPYARELEPRKTTVTPGVPRPAPASSAPCGNRTCRALCLQGARPTG